MATKVGRIKPSARTHDASRATMQTAGVCDAVCWCHNSALSDCAWRRDQSPTMLVARQQRKPSGGAKPL
ncbi:unnamed protein product, partial [Iphiclides podalirius]